MVDKQLEVQISSLKMPNPVMTASGTFGYGREFEPYVNLYKLGAIVVKGISIKPRPGNPPPRIVETPCGMLNAIGLENVGVDAFIKNKLPYLVNMNCRVIVNVLGDTIEEYVELAQRLNDVPGVDGLELNISCPNVKKGGVAFGTNASMANEVTMAARKATKLPLIVKLSPNVTDITEMARAVEEGGADAVSLINTLIGMAIDINNKNPVLANIIGGLSGPAIKPVALRMVWQVSDAVDIPVIGIGGISKWNDAVEFILAGAAAIQVGTANFVNPRVSEDIIEGLKSYMDNNKYSTIDAIKGKAKMR